MTIYRLAWSLWIVGTILILLSWTNSVTPEVGWTGFVMALIGALLSWMPNHSQRALSPEQKPVPPSGIQINRDTPLEVGTRVLIYLQGNWWCARIVAIEDAEMVRVELPAWDPGLQYRVPRTHLQLDPMSVAPVDTRIREGKPS